MNILDQLNPHQREAVTYTLGPMLILAGAGSGKTRVIIHRIAELIREQIPTSMILGVTFTNKAADEMKARLAELLGDAANGVRLSTFHSLGVRILRETIHHLGYHKNFVIYDTPDQLVLIRTVMEDQDLEDSPLIDPKSVQQTIHLAKTSGVSPEEMLSPNTHPHTRLEGQIYRRYQEMLKGCNALDFEDILNLTLELFEKHSEAIREVTSRFRYVMVDEYQDTNSVQYRLLCHLVEPHRNLCVVGDDDQSIYGWRGAEPANLFRFEKDFPNAKLIRLEQNYRSTEVILKAANQLIRNNTQRLPKELWSEKPGGNLIDWILAEDETKEMETVVRRIRLQTMRHGRKLSDYCILYRSHFQSRAVEEALRDARVPYRIVGSQSFFERQEVRDVLAYLKLIQNPGDEVSLQRIVNTPRRGIGKTSLVKLIACSRAKGISSFQLMKKARTLDGVTPLAAHSMEAFATFINDFSVRFEKGNLASVMRELIDELDYKRHLELQKGDPRTMERRLAVVQEQLRGAERYADDHPGRKLADYLERISLFSENDDEPDHSSNALTLMTLHAAKGLEFPFVFMVGMSEELFPNRRSLEENMEEEERRLCYVGITRARHELTFSMARSRRRYGEKVLQEPSRFLLEIDPVLFSTPVEGEPTPVQKTLQQDRARSDFFDNLKQFEART